MKFKIIMHTNTFETGKSLFIFCTMTTENNNYLVG